MSSTLWESKTKIQKTKFQIHLKIFKPCTDSPNVLGTQHQQICGYGAAYLSTELLLMAQRYFSNLKNQKKLLVCF